MFSFTLSEILTELKTRYSSYLLLLLSNSEERLGAETAWACHFTALLPTFPLGSHQMLGRFVKNQPVMLNTTIQREQKWKSNKVDLFPEYLFFFFPLVGLVFVLVYFYFFFLGASPKISSLPSEIVFLEQGPSFPLKDPGLFIWVSLQGCPEKGKSKKHQPCSLFVVTAPVWVLSQVGTSSRSQDTSAPSLTPRRLTA